MKRWLVTLVIVALIVTGVIWEQLYVKHTFRQLENKLTVLMSSVATCGDDDVDTAENIAQAQELEEYWLKKERGLCYLVKHTETFQISDTIIYAKNFITFGNKEEAMLALQKLHYLFSVHHYNLGTSIENII